jgi:hypothetical protein
VADEIKVKTKASIGRNREEEHNSKLVTTRYDYKVRKLATMCLPWQQWTETSVWFDDVGISAFHSCVVVDLWHLLLSKCVLACRH